MGLGIEILMNFRTNNKLFSESMKGLNFSTDQFTKTFQAQAEAASQKWGVGVDIISDKIKSISPIMLSLNEGMRNVGEDFVLNRTLGKTGELIDSLSDKMFGLGDVSGLFDFDDSKIKQMKQSMLEMNSVKLVDLEKSMSAFMSAVDNFSPKQQKQYANLMKDLGNAETPENLEKISKHMTAITDAPINKLKDDFKDFAKQTGRSLGYILGFGSIVGIWNEIMTVQTEMSKNIWQMGKVGTEAFSSMDSSAVKAAKANIGLKESVRKTTNDFMKMNARLATSTQASLSEVGQTMGELMQMRVGTKLPGDFESLTETSILMSKALGISSSTANNFVKDLSMIGGVGKDGVRAAAEEINKVQQNLGLAESEVVLVGQTVGRLTRQFRAFGGGTAKDIKIVTKEVSKMSAAFASVGLDASEASSIIMDMMNPDNLQKSVLLWSSMGMSASEGFAMMHGEGKNMEDMTKKMVIAAKNLKSQYGGNIFALKAMAEAQGLSLEQVQALSTYDDKKLDDMKKTAKLEEASQAARQGINDQLTRMSNQLMIIVQTWLLPMLKILSDLLEPLIAGVAWINKLATSTNKLHGIFGKLIQGVLIGFTLFITGILPKLGSVFSLLKGGFTGVIDNIKSTGKAISGLHEGAKGFWSAMKEPNGFFKNLKKGFDNVFGKKPDINNAFPEEGKDLASKIKQKTSDKKSIEQTLDTKALDQKKSPILEQVSKISPAQIWAIAGAILAIGLAIGIIVLSTAQLAKAMNDLNMEQMIGLVSVMAIIMGGMVAVIYAFAAAITALGAAGTIGAPGLLAIGAAIFMIAAGVALIILSITGLVKAFAGLGENAGAVASGITSIVLSISALVLSAALLVGAVAILAYALISASAGIAVFSGALIALALTMPLLIGIGRAANGVGESFLNMGIGIKLMAENFAVARTGLQAFKAELGGNWKGIADGAIAEIERINASLAEMQKINLGSMATNIVTNVLNKSAGEKESANNIETSDYTSQFNIANTHLNAISQNTSKTNSLLSELIKETKTSAKIRTKITMTANMGVS